MGVEERMQKQQPDFEVLFIHSGKDTKKAS